MLSVNSITTRDYWIAARFMSPEIGFFHHELASLELYILKDRVTALAIINECMKTARAALHCQQLLTDLKNSLRPAMSPMILRGHDDYNSDMKKNKRF